MNDLIPTIFICIAILIALVIIPFFIPYKLRLIKFICWGIVTLIVIFLFVVPPLNLYYNRQEEKHLFGTYKIDIKNSSYHNIDLGKFKSLTLTIKGDYTFKLNNNAPFFVSDGGTWLYWIDGDAEYIKFKFVNAKRTYVIDKTDSGSLTLNNNILSKGNKDDKITFKPE